jgi:outer membrane receptor protein involved in Fe transport
VLVPERSVSAASRETEAIEDAPASVTVISTQELEAFAYPTILEDRRRIDTSTTEQSDRAVVVDAVISGAIARHGLCYAAGVYNLFNWQYALPALPYASALMPQNGRSFILSLTATR